MRDSMKSENGSTLNEKRIKGENSSAILIAQSMVEPGPSQIHNGKDVELEK